MKERNSKNSKMTGQTNHKLVKSLSSRNMFKSAQISIVKKVNPYVKNIKNYEIATVASLFRGIRYPSRNKSSLEYFSSFNNNSIKKTGGEVAKIKFTQIIDQTDDISQTNGPRTQVLKKDNSSFIELQDEIKQIHNNKVPSLRAVVSNNSKHSTHCSSVYSEIKSARQNNNIQSFNKSVVDKDEMKSEINKKPSYSKLTKFNISSYKNKDNDIKQINYNLPISSLNYYRNQGTNESSRRRMPGSCSIGAGSSSRRNKPNNIQSINDSCVVGFCSSSNILSNRKGVYNNFAQAETAEEVHFKLVEIFQQKKNFFINLAKKQADEADDIDNCYLEKELSK